MLYADVMRLRIWGIRKCPIGTAVGEPLEMKVRVRQRHARYDDVAVDQADRELDHTCFRHWRIVGPWRIRKRDVAKNDCWGSSELDRQMSDLTVPVSVLRAIVLDRMAQPVPVENGIENDQRDNRRTEISDTAVTREAASVEA